jgi:hypothetical protein
MKTIFTVQLLSLLFTAGIVNAQSTKSTSFDLRTDMRKLWEDHVTWTRNVIFNVIDDLPGINDDAARLLNNQVDIGNAIRPFYGDATGDELTRLLHNHITIAADLLVALKTDNTAAFNTANTNWYANADSIARFLSSINPNWPYADMKDMMNTHLNLTATEALARKNADYPGDVVAYDNVHNEILAMSDMLSNGIIKQFPNAFKGGPVSRNQTAELSNMSAVLNQNVPNPFDDHTVIDYTIPEDATNAQLIIYDASGVIVKKVDLQAKGEGALTLHSSNLKKGMYSYSLIVDGKVIDTKKMFH